MWRYEVSYPTEKIGYFLCKSLAAQKCIYIKYVVWKHLILFGKIYGVAPFFLPLVLSDMSLKSMMGGGRVL